jgi:hypothetical protein
MAEPADPEELEPEELEAGPEAEPAAESADSEFRRSGNLRAACGKGISPRARR